MGIALGAHTSVAVNSAASAAQASSAITTTTGSTVVALACYTGTWVSFTDSQGNTWVQVGTQQTVGGLLARAFRCDNITGHAAHTFTVTLSVAGDAVSFWVVEATGAATASIDGETMGTDATTPFDSAGLTTTQAAEMLISIIAEDVPSAGNITHACGSSFTAITADEIIDTNTLVTGISSYRIVAATGTYNSSVTLSLSPNSTGIVLVAIKEAAGGGGGGSDAGMGGTIGRRPLRPRPFAPGLAR